MSDQRAGPLDHPPMKDENGEDPGELAAALPLADPQRFAQRAAA